MSAVHQCMIKASNVRRRGPRHTRKILTKSLFFSLASRQAGGRAKEGRYNQATLSPMKSDVSTISPQDSGDGRGKATVTQSKAHRNARRIFPLCAASLPSLPAKCFDAAAAQLTLCLLVPSERIPASTASNVGQTHPGSKAPGEIPRSAKVTHACSP